MAVDNKGFQFWDPDTQSVLNVGFDGVLPVQTYVECLEEKISKLEERVKQLEEAFMEKTLLGENYGNT